MAVRLKELIGRGFALLVALLLGVPPAWAETREANVVAPPRTASVDAAPRPAIWLIEDADTKIYLFGTTHVFPSTLRWRSAALNRVIAEADELVMETPDASNDDLDPSRMLAPMEMGKSVNILERVSPAARPALANAIAATGMPQDYFDRLHLWAAAFLLTSFQMVQDMTQDEPGGTPPQLSGAEMELGALFRGRKRPISGVETMEEQLGFFATMPLGAQRRFLEMTVMGTGGSDAEASGASPADLTGTAWVRGDVEAIAAEMGAMPRELYEVLLTRRNRNWTVWLQQRMERPGTVLFAVGAGHLAGPDSVQRMLAARGLEVRRID